MNEGLINKLLNKIAGLEYRNAQLEVQLEEAKTTKEDKKNADK